MMKYRELIQFDPIESVIELRSADDQRKAEELVRSYVMSDSMADLVQAKILSQLCLENVIDNKGVLLVGNYGTGKSHLMSVISSIASDEHFLLMAQNEKFRTDAVSIAGRFEVLRIEIGSTQMSLRSIIISNIEQDLAKRCIPYTFPDVSAITNNKDALTDMMAAFGEKYNTRGYLIVVDELLDYLKSRKDNELMLDLNFMRELGEIIKTTRFRFISGVQEQLFENSAFHYVSNSLLKMKDRYEQVLIRSEEIAYVAKHRVLSKTSEQKAMIRAHLQPFCKLYQNMADRLEEYVDLFPIHPAYIHTFQHIITVEKREVLKTISETISAIIDTEISTQEPGIISYDTYWKRIKENPSLRTDPAVHEVLQKSSVLEDIIQRSFPKNAYKGIALQVIYALSVHRLTTVDLDARLGLTAMNLKDDLALFIPMPVMQEDFLLSTLNVILRDIMNTVSGQFIEYNKDNEQYYLDLKKDVDYDKKIQEKADFLGDDHLNRYFFDVMLSALDWSAPEYVQGHNIFQYNINWTDKNIFRRGYLFLGNSNDRPTAQPEEDFYVYIMPLFSKLTESSKQQRDEVYLTFQMDGKFTELLKNYAGAREMEILSASGETKSTYIQRGKSYLTALRRWMEEHKSTLFRVGYCSVEKPLLDYLKGMRMNELTVRDTVEHAASKALSGYFTEKYRDYPRFQNRVTKDNLPTIRQEAINAIVGRSTQLGTSVLESFGLILNGKIRIENSPYASYFISMLKKLPDGNVLNRSDIMDDDVDGNPTDKHYHFDEALMSILLTALVYGGQCVLVASDNQRYDAASMEALSKISPTSIYKFKRLEKPKTMNVQMLRRLFVALNINDGLLASSATQDAAIETLQKQMKEYGDKAFRLKAVVDKSTFVWGESLIPTNQATLLKEQMTVVHKCADDIRSRFTTPAKLKNFDFSEEQMTALEQGIAAMGVVTTVQEFRDSIGGLMNYISNAQLKLPEDSPLRAQFEEQKQAFFTMRSQLLEPGYDTTATDDLAIHLEALRDAYASDYMQRHSLYRLGIDAYKRKGKLLESATLKSLHILRGIQDILSHSQLNDLLTQLNQLKVCYQCTTQELKESAECPHCHFNPADADMPVNGRLDFIEDKLDQLLMDWTNQILSALDDPMLDAQKALLSKPQRAIIDRFVETKRLPIPLDQQFVESVNTMLSGLESVEINIHDMQQTMMNWGPCAPDEFKMKLSQWLDQSLRGHDKNKARIVIKG